MGGYMSYQRMRSRSNLMFRKPDDDPDPYHRPPDMTFPSHNTACLVGDLNRMERDYLGSWPDTGSHPHSEVRSGSERCLSDEVADMTGVDVETVKKVLRCVFFEQR